MKAAIVCDNYKLAKFQSKLRAAGFKFEVVDGISKGTKSIIVETDSKDIMRLHSICAQVESWAMHRN